MQISDGERLIISMLADLLEANPADRQLDASLIRTLVCNKEDWALAWEYPAIFEGEPRDPQVVKETSDILWMWGIVEHWLGKLQGDQATEAASWHYTKFGGFDGNNDPHYGCAHTMIEKLGRYNNFKNRGLNSHSSASLPRYRRMYATFMKYVEAGQANPLSFDALKEICN